MANNLKPSSDLLTSDIEVQINILEYSGMYGSTSGNGLVEGSSYAGWSDGNVCYWYEKNAYVIFEVDSPCNIWIISTDRNISHTNKLKIYKYNQETDEYDIDVSYKYCNEDTVYKTSIWNLWLQNINPGKYKVTNENESTVRPIHGEWYAENITKIIQYNFKDGEDILKTKTILENETLDNYLFIKPNEVLVGWEEEIVSDTPAKKVINLNPIYLPYECISENNKIELKKEIYNKLKEIVEKYIIESESEG